MTGATPVPPGAHLEPDMSAFADDMAASVTPALLDYLGEPVVFATAAGVTKTLQAIITRGILEVRAEGGPERLEYETHIQFALADWPTPVINSDRVTFYRRLGDAQPVTLPLSSLVDQRGGMWTFKVN